MLKNEKKKTRSIKTREPSIEYQIVTDIIFKLTGSQSLPVFTEAALEVEGNKIN